ncbi:hypothetical protein BDN72DRAFT_815502 [Pluteus cervinus]|uniref:Uncharacterized protein n=1 Tax=Pluteus cervinus TaxID=181527 RepID=A0ACD3B4I7_9AGAR|nr:hypothetical protein BDN72DRAFT_815502 [Pluteus cervinus]
MATFDFHCLLYGEKLRQSFVVRIDRDYTVSLLKSAIKKVKHLTHRDVTALTIWKVAIPWNDEAAIKAFIPRDDEAKGVTCLKNPFKKLSGIFPTELSKAHIHVIVQVSEPRNTSAKLTGQKSEERDIVTEIESRRRGTVAKIRAAKVSFKASGSNGYITFQSSGVPIYDGRYVPNKTPDTRAPPIQLYHPAFAGFLDDIGNDTLEVPTEVVRATARFMHASSALYDDENTRRLEVVPHLAQAISIQDLGFTTFEGVATASLPAAFGPTHAAIIIHEFGEDPSTLAELSYGRFWVQNDCAKILETCCCPTFLLATAGPWFAVLGAIFTDKVVVQRLTSYIWIGNDTVLSEPSIYRVARILHALGTNLHRLKGYYESLEVRPHIENKIHPLCFPSINAYRASDNSIVNFAYIEPLERESICTTFLAETLEATSKRIVIKFVDGKFYGDKAHKLLADNGMAPELLYFGRVGIQEEAPSYGHLRMVVMDYIDGITAKVAQDLPQSFTRRVRDIVTVLHSNGYVFGDLRSPNIMITTTQEVKFIDFDWAGEDGKSTYPLLMSERINWPEGVEIGGAVMKKEHDIFMLEQLLQEKGLSVEDPYTYSDTL